MSHVEKSAIDYIGVVGDLIHPLAFAPVLLLLLYLRRFVASALAKPPPISSR